MTVRSSVERLTAKDAKHMVGRRLKENCTYRGMLEREGRRCWTLMYAEDDGVGFAPDSIRGGLGLLSIRERVQALDGRVRIASVPNHGTVLQVSIPAGVLV